MFLDHMPIIMYKDLPSSLYTLDYFVDSEKEMYTRLNIILDKILYSNKINPGCQLCNDLKSEFKGLYVKYKKKFKKNSQFEPHQQKLKYIKGLSVNPVEIIKVENNLVIIDGTHRTSIQKFYDYPNYEHLNLRNFLKFHIHTNDTYFKSMLEKISEKEFNADVVEGLKKGFDAVCSVIKNKGYTPVDDLNYKY